MNDESHETEFQKHLPLKCKKGIMKAATYLPSQTGQSHKMRTFNSYCLNFKKDLNKHISVPRLQRLSKEIFLFVTSIDVAYEMRV